jgi:hypothetical protein
LNYISDFKKEYNIRYSIKETCKRIACDELIPEFESYLNLIAKPICKDIEVYLDFRSEIFIVFGARIPIEIPESQHIYHLELAYLWLDRNLINEQYLNTKIQMWLEDIKYQYSEVKILRDRELLLKVLLFDYAKQYPNVSKLVMDLTRMIEINKLSRLGRKEHDR